MMGYYLPPAGLKRVETLVARIEGDQGDLIKPGEFDEASSELDMGPVMANLPEGMSEEDFIGVIRLAMLTECATDTYANAITQRAREYKADWLEHFNEAIWKPDEYAHTEPFKLMLLKLGFAESELDREIAETQERQFEHVGGSSPAHVTTFGFVQEYLTDNWYGMIAKVLRKRAPLAAQMTYRIKKRETLHTVWYRDMTSIQVETNPELLSSVTYELVRFRLPGNSLCPELQDQAERWLQLMGADFDRIVKDLVHLTYTVGSSPRLLGRLALDLIDQKGVKIGPITPNQISQAMNRLGGLGYGLVGEAVLERAGLAFLYKAQEASMTGNNVPQRIRTALRSWLANQIPLSIITT